LARYVTDANVLIGWLLALPAAESFVGQLTTGDDVFAAQILLPECTSVIRSAAFDRRVDQVEAREMLSRLTAFPLQLVAAHQQFMRALELAQRFQHRNAYDMQYLAVAELMDAELVTLDGGMRHAAEEAGVPVRLLA
jgi:predicted nucleic acid-binding protein